jgi:hypothetical protein
MKGTRDTPPWRPMEQTRGPALASPALSAVRSADVMRGVSGGYSGFFKPEGARRLASSVMHRAWIMLA